MREEGISGEPGDSVLVLADGAHMTEALALASAANAGGAKAALMDISSIVAEGLLVPGIPEPPKHVSVAAEELRRHLHNQDRDRLRPPLRPHHDGARGRRQQREDRLGRGGHGLVGPHRRRHRQGREERKNSLIKRFKGADKIHVTSKQGTDTNQVLHQGAPRVKVTPVRSPGAISGRCPWWGEAAYAAIEGSETAE